MEYSSYGLLDIRFSDFTARHVFAAKLRLVILLGFWGMCFLFYPGLLLLKQPIVLIISGTFVVTTICYIFILKGLAPIFFFIIELAADVAAQTVVVYLTGGVSSNFFTIYIIYCCAGGLFYNYKVSAVIALLSLLFYSGLLLSTHLGWITVFSYPFREIGLFPQNPLLQNWSVLAIFLVIGIYGIRIAHHFTQVRENALESKNRELVSLNRVSSTTRGGYDLNLVHREVIQGVKQGLGYETAFLLFRDEEQSVMRPYIPKDEHYSDPFEQAIGQSLEGRVFSLHNEENLIAQVIHQKKVFIRYELSALTSGSIPPIPKENAELLQKKFGLKKFIAAPLVAEQKIFGVLVAVTRDPWIEPDAVKAFEGFSDQAALVIDNVLLIEKLRQQNAELERVSRVKSEFLSTMSHELRTPLTAIIGFSELLLDGAMGDLTGDQKESLREVLTNGESLLDLINSLLDLAKIESGKMEFHLEPVDLLGLLDRIEGMIHSLIHKKSHQLSLQVPEELRLIYADEKKLQQILLNLISNAIKFTPDEGKIVVSIKRYEMPLPKEITAHIRSPGNFSKGALEFSVCDNGIGIPAKHLGKIFDSFQQVDSSFTREHQGTGLGLALTRQFVELHGGEIWVESRPDQGSVFTFLLPWVTGTPALN